MERSHFRWGRADRPNRRRRHPPFPKRGYTPLYTSPSKRLQVFGTFHKLRLSQMRVPCPCWRRPNKNADLLLFTPSAMVSVP